MTLTAIIFAGILTYFTRMTMIALISRDMLGDKIKAVLEYVPSAVFPAIIFPGIFINDFGTFIEMNDPKIFGALVAVIVYIAGVSCKAVGSPQIVPLLVPKLRPAGSAGEIDQLEGLPMMACPALCIWPKVYAVPLLYMKYRLSLRL